MVKAIMCQVHGSIWRAAVWLCAEKTPHLISSSNLYFLQLDFLNKKIKWVEWRSDFQK